MASQNVQVAAAIEGFPTFTDNGKLRLLMGALLYLAQGIPQGVVFYAIPSWLAVNGQSAAAVGSVVAAVSLPWSLKFIFGAVVDRYTFLPMGRRRAWLIGAQLLIVAIFTLMAIRSPAPDEIWLVVGFVFVLSAFTALQDVALDAMVIDLTPDEEMGKINGCMFGGKLSGIAVGSALTAYFLEYHNFAVAMLVALGLFAIPAISAILIRERPGERYLPWTSGVASRESLEIKPDAWVPLLRESYRLLLRRDPLLIIALSASYGIHQGLFEATTIMFAANELGWGETRFASLGGVMNMVAALFALSVGGWATDRIGPGRIALWTAMVIAAVLAIVLLLNQYWQSGIFFTVWYCIYFITATFFYLCMITLGMRVCEARVAATSYTLITASMALGMAIGGASLGLLDHIGGFYAMFGATLLTILISGSMALGLSRKTGGPANSVENSKSSQLQEI